MPLSFPHLTSTRQITKADADLLLKTCKEMEKVLQKGGDDRLAGKILAALFYEPSTRTRLSFEAAMQRLGGKVISAEGIQFSSMYKGESIEDTMRMVSQYSDIIVMRHPEKGSANRARDVATVPFINAGDGPGDHPTQGLLDLYTIEKERGGIDGAHVAIVGDLLNGRTLHAMSLLVGLYKDVKFTLISPPELKMPGEYIDYFKEKHIPYDESEKLEDGLDANILYMTRIQKERFNDAAEYERLKNAYILTAKHLAGRDITVMHPLPRVNEIAADVDALPNAAYFRQAKNGLVMRMALMGLMLK